MAVLNRFETLLRQKIAAEDRDISITEVADEIGVSRDTLSRYAGQKITLYNSKVVDAICRYFKVDVGTFLYLDPAIESKSPDSQVNR
jgi:transcriptional regulator with XRE-family HTH domain